MIRWPYIHQFGSRRSSTASLARISLILLWVFAGARLAAPAAMEDAGVLREAELGLTVPEIPEPFVDWREALATVDDPPSREAAGLGSPIEVLPATDAEGVPEDVEPDDLAGRDDLTPSPVEEDALVVEPVE